MSEGTLNVWKALQSWLKVWGHRYPKPIVMYVGKGSFISAHDQFYSFRLGTEPDGTELWFAARCSHGGSPRHTESYAVSSATVRVDQERHFGGIDNAKMVWKADQVLAPEVMPAAIDPHEVVHRLWLELQSIHLETHQQYLEALEAVGLLEVDGPAENQAYPYDMRSGLAADGSETAQRALKELEYRRGLYERTVRMMATLQKLVADAGVVLK